MAETKQTFKVEGMSCSGCANLLRSVLEEDVTGVSKADVSLEQQAVEITFDDTTCDLESAAATAQKNGFTLNKA